MNIRKSPPRRRVAVFACIALAGATAASPTLDAQAPLARVTGVAFDSVAMRPLAGAMLQLVSAADPSRVRTATANERGSYTIDSVAAGTYLLGFFHPRLDSLSIDAPLQRVDIRTAGDVRTFVAIPSGRTLVAQLCGPAMAQQSRGVFIGVVRSSRGEALPGPARIRAQWTEVSVGLKGIERRMPSQTVTTSPGGAFVLCGIPVEGTFMARAFVSGDSSGFVELEAPSRGLLYRDVYVGAATKTTVPSATERVMTVLRGNGQLRGVVRSISGAPIRDARLVLWGSGREDTTNASGQFALSTLPAGTYTLEARALGFLPARAAVDVLEGATGPATAELVMDAFVPTIDTMRVRADRNALDKLADFERRKRGGGGYFLDETTLSRRAPMYMSDIFRMAPGMTISPNDMSGDRIMMRGTAGAGSCLPAVYIDGAPVQNLDGTLDNLVNPQSVRAVEIYTRTVNVPMEFRAMNGCGSIVIWTGMRRAAEPRR